MLKTDTGNVLKPEQFEILSDTEKETVIKVLGNAGLSAVNTDAMEGLPCFCHCNDCYGISDKK